MKYIVSLFLLFISANLLATDATDVSIMHLNGPVKSYSKDRETFHFDRSGNLTHAKRSTKVDVIVSWDEYYTHTFDENGKRIRTYVYKDSTCKGQRNEIGYDYNEDGTLKEHHATRFSMFPEWNWKNILSEYGKKKHKPNSVTKKVHKADTIFCSCKEKQPRRCKDTTYCSYNEKGELTLYKRISPLLCYEISFGEDTITSIRLNGYFTYVTNSKDQLLEFSQIYEDEANIERYKYNEQGLLVEKSMYRKNYCKGMIFWGIRNIDCVITYKYDSWNNLVGEEWYHKDTKKTDIKNYPIEYY